MNKLKRVLVPLQIFDENGIPHFERLKSEGRLDPKLMARTTESLKFKWSMLSNTERLILLKGIAFDGFSFLTFLNVVVKMTVNDAVECSEKYVHIAEEF